MQLTQNLMTFNELHLIHSYQKLLSVVSGAEGFGAAFLAGNKLDGFNLSWTYKFSDPEDREGNSMSHAIIVFNIYPHCIPQIDINVCGIILESRNFCIEFFD